MCNYVVPTVLEGSTHENQLWKVIMIFFLSQFSLPKKNPEKKVSFTTELWQDYQKK